MAQIDIFDLPSIEEIELKYKDIVKSNNSKTNPYTQYSDWDFKAKALAGITGGAHADIRQYGLNIYPQFQSGIAIDLTLASKGLPPRIPTTYGSGYCQTEATTFPFMVTSGTTLTNPSTNTQYIVTQDILVTGTSTKIPFIASTPGIGSQETINTHLTISPSITSGSETINYLVVKSSTDGSLAESDAQAQQRLLNALQIPAAGARQTDYYNFALQANDLLDNPEVTDAIVIPRALTYLQQFVMGVFALGGSQPDDYLLNQSLINGNSQIYYTRTLSDTAVAAVVNSIYNQKLIALNLYIGTNDTYILPANLGQPLIAVEVTLAPNVTLNQVLTIQSTDQFGEPLNIQITVANLIKREVRRAIVTMPYGAVVDNNSNRYIPISSIEKSLDYGLSSSNFSGVYASIIADRKVTVYNGSSYGDFDISVPSLITSSTNIQFTYDIAYTNITVSV